MWLLTMNVRADSGPNLLRARLRQDGVRGLVERPGHGVGAGCVVEVGAASDGVGGNGGRRNGYRCLGCDRGWTCWKRITDVLNMGRQLLVVHLDCHDNRFRHGTLLDVSNRESYCTGSL